MENDLITIIIPVYNTEKYLPRCMKSILKQTYTNIEIILVNDGSIDNSGKICDEYEKLDKRIRVFHTKNEGQSKARNLGIENSNGKYIVFVDSDDFVSPVYIEKLYNLLISEHSDISVGGTMKFHNEHDIEKKENNNLNIIRQNFNKEEAIKQLLFFNGLLTNYPVCKLFKKELFNNVKFPEGKKFEDIDIIYRLFNISTKISLSNEIIYYYYINNGATTGNLKINSVYDKIGIILERDTFLKKEYPSLSKFCDDYLGHAFIVIFKQLLKLEGKGIKTDEEYNNLKEKIILTKGLRLNFREQVLMFLIKLNNGVIYDIIYKVSRKGKKNNE